MNILAELLHVLMKHGKPESQFAMQRFMLDTLRCINLTDRRQHALCEYQDYP